MGYLDSHGLATFWTKLKGTFLQDAPSDNKQYARKNGSWNEVAAGGGGVIVSAVAPTGDSSILWIDTANGNISKYWNGSAWVANPGTWG